MTKNAIPFWLKALALALAAAALVWAIRWPVNAYRNSQQARYDAGYKAGQSACAADHARVTSKAREQQVQEAAAEIQRQSAQGAAAEQRQAAIDAHFDNLGARLAAVQKKGANHETLPLDGCNNYVLPAERLRIWEAASRGDFGGGAEADLGAAAIQPDRSTAPFAAASQRAASGFGDQSLANSAPVPPLGGTTLRSAAVFAVDPAGLSPVAGFGGR